MGHRFQDVCSTYNVAGFEARLAELIPVGKPAMSLDDLLDLADSQTSDHGATTYVFSYATGAFSEQGLVVSIAVDDESGQITAVESAVAAN